MEDLVHVQHLQALCESPTNAPHIPLISCTSLHWNLKHAHPLVDRLACVIPPAWGRCHPGTSCSLPESRFKTLTHVCVWCVCVYPVKITRRRTERTETVFLCVWPHQCVQPINIWYQPGRNHLNLSMDTAGYGKWGNNNNNLRLQLSGFFVCWKCEWGDHTQLLAAKMSGKIESKQGKTQTQSSSSGVRHNGTSTHGWIKCGRTHNAF